MVKIRGRHVSEDIMIKVCLNRRNPVHQAEHRATVGAYPFKILCGILGTRVWIQVLSLNDYCCIPDIYPAKTKKQRCHCMQCLPLRTAKTAFFLLSWPRDP